MWYLATFIQASIVDDEPDCLVYLNQLVVQAEDWDSAYRAALELGQDENVAYKSVLGQQVTVRFEGIHALTPIGPTLEHGTCISITPRDAALTATPRHELVVITGPPYLEEGQDDGMALMPMDVWEAATEIVAQMTTSRPRTWTGWWLADCILEAPTDVYATHLLLIGADSPELAYEQGLTAGAAYAEQLAATFHGLYELYEVYDELEHGAEILYSALPHVPLDEIPRLRMDAP